MRHDVFTSEEEILFMDQLTYFLNQGKVGAMFRAILVQEVKDTDLERIVTHGDEGTEAQMDRVLNIECAFRNWLLLKYIQQNL